MREHPFETVDELDTYVGGPKIQCLECGRWFKSLATHLPRIHGMSHDDYREKWGIPRRYALSGTATRETLSRQIRDQIESGRLTYDHLPGAVDAARDAPRPCKSPADDARHRQLVAEIRPGDHSRLPPGAYTADGRDADRRRLQQQIRRAENAGDIEAARKVRRQLTIVELKRELGPNARELRNDRKQYRLMPHERELMRKHYAEHGPAILAEVLDRHYGTITAAAWRMRLISKDPHANNHAFRWDRDTHDEQLVNGIKNGKTLKEIAAEIGTSTNTVGFHAKRLEIKPRMGRSRNPRRNSP